MTILGTDRCSDDRVALPGCRSALVSRGYSEPISSPAVRIASAMADGMRPQRAIRIVPMTNEFNERFHRICQRARELWESDGRPLNKHEELWQRAMIEIDAMPFGPPEKPAADDTSSLSRAATTIKNISTRPERNSLMKRPTFFKMHSSKQ